MVINLIWLVFMLATSTGVFILLFVQRAQKKQRIKTHMMQKWALGFLLLCMAIFSTLVIIYKQSHAVLFF